VPLKKARRIPRRFNRPVTRETKKLLKRRHKRSKKRRILDTVQRLQRRFQRFFATFKHSCIQWFVFAVIGLILLGGGLVLFSPIIEVRELRVTRVNARLDIEEVQRVLAPFFGRHLLFLPVREVVQTLEASLADIKHVEIQKQYPSQLIVRIELDPLYAQLTILNPDMEGGETSIGATIDFLTDQGIYVVAFLPEESATLPMMRLVDWGVRPQEGTRLVSPDFLVRMQETERALKEQFGQNVTVRTIILRAQEYHLQTDNGLTVWFDTRVPLEDQLLRYRTFLRSVHIDDVEEYVDLRLADRVIYK